MDENKIDYQILPADLEFLKKYPLDLIGWNYYRPCYITKGDYQK
ncbi:hypothetical protein P344_00515 [Spiroplasma mirum ATCC 29335]|uniref:6-phospho-beta-glucosidase n=1 Tax=Spiroplasma mirum ATCC 29335 TaxID=838561 RepID=W6AKC0_9MOLU|nr:MULTISPECIES: hypothetical protein [Spiroplasma]AHI57476.1 hypothetical protein P344_00515 [Spiroplasma mirum ATCC 29335]